MAQKGYRLTAESARLLKETVDRVTRLPADERGREVRRRRFPLNRSVLPLRVTSSTPNADGLYPAVWLRYDATRNPPCVEQDQAVWAVSLAGDDVPADYYHGILVGLHSDGVPVFDVVPCCSVGEVECNVCPGVLLPRTLCGTIHDVGAAIGPFCTDVSSIDGEVITLYCPDPDVPDWYGTLTLYESGARRIDLLAALVCSGGSWNYSMQTVVYNLPNIVAYCTTAAWVQTSGTCDPFSFNFKYTVAGTESGFDVCNCLLSNQSGSETTVTIAACP